MGTRGAEGEEKGRRPKEASDGIISPLEMPKQSESQSGKTSGRSKSSLPACHGQLDISGCVAWEGSELVFSFTPLLTGTLLTLCLARQPPSLFFLR